MIIVKLFAIMKDRVGRDELKMNAANGTVADLLREVAQEYPALSDVLASGRIVVSVNQELVKLDARVKDGDEVALMPPFSGGAGGRVRVQNEPFSLDQEIEPIEGVLIRDRGDRDLSRHHAGPLARQDGVEAGVRALSRHG